MYDYAPSWAVFFLWMKPQGLWVFSSFSAPQIHAHTWWLAVQKIDNGLPLLFLSLLNISSQSPANAEYFISEWQRSFGECQFYKIIAILKHFPRICPWYLDSDRPAFPLFTVILKHIFTVFHRQMLFIPAKSKENHPVFKFYKTWNYTSIHTQERCEAFTACCFTVKNSHHCNLTVLFFGFSVII